MEENQGQVPQPPIENPAIVKNEHKPSGLKSKWPFLVIALLLVLLGIFGGYFVLNQTNKSAVALTPTPQDNGKPCTQEAKICPDGSGVGRTGPKCEFAECPNSTSAETANWKTYTNIERGYSFKYPAGYTLSENQATANNLENVSLEKDAEIAQGGGMGGGDAIVSGSIISFTILPQKNLSDTELKRNYGSDTVVSQTQLGGKEVTKAALDTYPTSDRYFYSYNPKVLEIAANVPNTELNQAKFSEYNDEYKQILSTFKFTN